MIYGKICITGATGFIGNNLFRALVGQTGIPVTAIVRSIAAAEQIRQLNGQYYLDDGNTERLIEFFRQQKFTIVVHLASLYLKEHQSHQIEDLVLSNVLFGTRLLEASVKSSVRTFINTGTFWQHFENKEYSPVNLYAASKQAFEAMARYYQESAGLHFTTVYLNDTYGPGDTRKKILNLWKAMQDTDSMNMSPGEQKINLLHIRDLVEGYLRMIELALNGELPKEVSAYVLKGTEELNLRELAALFEQIARKKLHINWGSSPYKSREVMTIWTGGTPVPGWQPKVLLRAGLQEFLQ